LRCFAYAHTIFSRRTLKFENLTQTQPDEPPRFFRQAVRELRLAIAAAPYPTVCFGRSALCVSPKRSYHMTAIYVTGAACLAFLAVSGFCAIIWRRAAARWALRVDRRLALPRENALRPS
jgi:hypothetical protein